MIFKINKAGVLEIKRADKWEKQYCPISGTNTNGTLYSCDDACALFGEPEHPMAKAQMGVHIVDIEDPEVVKLELCHKTLQCNAKDFVDERIEK